MITSNDKQNQRKNYNKKKLRNPGIDLVRIIGMYTLIMDHFIYFGNAFIKFNKYKEQLNFIKNFTNWNNDGFALISGIVQFKSYKYSNLLHLWLTVFFYSVGIHLYIKIFKKEFKINNDISIEFFPIIFRRYWYFTDYFGMYLYLPVINKGISLLTKSEFKLVVISTIGIFVLWRDLKNPNVDVFNIKGGFSMIWLLTFYLTGAYIGKYNAIYFGIKKYIFCLVCILIYVSSSYIYIKVHNNQNYLDIKNYQKIFLLVLKRLMTKRYDSFLKIAQSITLCLFFLQITYNKVLSKIICNIGPLCFGIYLIHVHPFVIENVLKHIFDTDPNYQSLNTIIFNILLKSLKWFIFSITIDYIRYLFFNLLRLRKICIIIEKYIIKLFS